MAAVETVPRKIGQDFEFGEPRRWVRTLVWVMLAFFGIHLLATIASVLVNSFAGQWFDTWLPTSWTLRWFSQSWTEFGLSQVLPVTFFVGLVVVLVSLLIAVPAAYALARSQMPGKKYVLLALALPVIVPTITYGVPLATLIYGLGLGGQLIGVILINLVPAVPFAILVLTPFMEAIDPRIEHAARMCGARTATIFRRIVVPLLRNGLLAVGIMLLVRALGTFDLTFLVAGPDSQTLVVALYYAVSAAGFRVNQSIDAMAVLYMATNFALLAFAFRYVNPARMMARSS
jgi:putative spermidine/putrescine transport system permease protein